MKRRSTGRRGCCVLQLLSSCSPSDSLAHLPPVHCISCQGVHGGYYEVQCYGWKG